MVSKWPSINKLKALEDLSVTSAQKTHTGAPMAPGAPSQRGTGEKFLFI